MSEEKTNHHLLTMLQDRYPNYHPLMAMAELANDEKTEDGIRFNCHKEIAKYVEPQLKSVEVRGRVKADFGVLRVVAADPLSLPSSETDEKLPHPVDISGAPASPEAA